MPSLTEITNALDARKIASGWIARCPAHEDKAPSLSIREQNGKVLVHCFSGCAQDEVIDALRSRGLWPESQRAGERRVPVTDDDWRDDLRRVGYWRHSARLLTEALLDKLSPTEPDRLPLTRLLAALTNLGDDGLISVYREHRRRDPALTAELVRAGRQSIVRTEEWLARWIVGGMRER